MAKLIALAKMATATVYGKISRIMVGDMEKAYQAAKATNPDAIPDIVHLYSVFGTAAKTFVREGIDGKPAIGIQGQFRALKLVNAATGEMQEFTSNILYLPSVATNMLEGALATSTSPVEFALDVGIKYDNGTKPSATGYVYAITPTEAPKETEAMQRLRTIALERYKALPAPAPAAVKESAASPASGKRK